MTHTSDPLPLAPAWHVDLRIEAELPEDDIVGRRFLVQLGFGAAAAAAFAYAAWLGFVAWDLQHQLRQWERRLPANRGEFSEVQQMERDFAVLAGRLAQAHALVRPQFVVSELVPNLGRTRPENAEIHQIEWNDLGVVIRGALREQPERASRLLGAYVDALRADAQIGPLFREVALTNVDRGTAGDRLRFEIVLRAKGGP